MALFARKSLCKLLLQLLIPTLWQHLRLFRGNYRGSMLNFSIQPQSESNEANDKKALKLPLKIKCCLLGLCLTAKCLYTSLPKSP